MKFRHTESMPSLANASDCGSSESSDSSDNDHSPPVSSITPTPTPIGHASSICLHGLDESSEDDNSSSSSARRAQAIEPHVGHKKVLVTGGAGFVGSSTAAHLLKRGDSVVVVDEINDYYDVRIKEQNLRRLREICPDKGRLAIYKGDICDEKFMQDLFEKERPEWICHMAARAGVRPSIQDPCE